MHWIVARSACVIVAAPLVLAGCFTEAGDTGGDDDDDDDTETGKGASGSATDPSVSSTDPTLPGTAGTGPVTDTETDTEDPDTTEGEGEVAAATTDEDVALFCRDVDMMLPTAATACNDFEGSGHEHGGWAYNQVDGGVAEVTAADAPERGSVAFTSFGDTDGSQPEAFVVLDQGDPTFLTRLQFRMDVASCDGDVTFASMSFPDEAVDVSLEYTVGGDIDLLIYDAMGLTNRYPLGVNVPADTGPWAKWEIRADLDAGYVDVLVDDDTVAQVTDFAPPEELTSAAAIRLGVTRKPTGFACAMAFDDVVRY